MRNVEILTAFYRTDIECSRRLVPQPLQVVNDIVIVHFYHMHDADWFGNYYESAVQIPVQMPETSIVGAYSPYLYLGSDGAVAMGREVYGQPKKGGQPRLELRDDLLVGTVSRNSIDVVTATLAYKQRRSESTILSTYGDFRTNINLKVVPAIDGSTAIRQLTARTLENVRIHECWSGPVTVELRPNAQAPVYRLPVRAMLIGVHWRTDFVLPWGQVLHDYLK